MNTLLGCASRLEVPQAIAKQELRTIQADRTKIQSHWHKIPTSGVEARSGVLKKVWLALVISCFCGGNSLLFAAAPKGVGQSQQIITQAVNQDGDGVGCVDNGSGNCGNTSGGGGGSPCLSRIAQPGYPRAWEAAINVAPFTTVNAVNRNLHIAIPIVSWSGLGPDMSMTLYYNSADTDASPTRAAQLRNSMGFDLGPGWRMSYSATIFSVGTDKLMVVADDGTQNIYTKVNGNWQAPPSVFSVLTIDPNATGPFQARYTLTHKDQSKQLFNFAGQLTRVEDAVGNAIFISRYANRIDRISDTSGRALRLDSGLMLNAIVALSGNDAIRAVPERTWQITYLNNRIFRVIDPEDHGIVVLTNVDTDHVVRITQKTKPSTTLNVNFYDFEYDAVYQNAVTTVKSPAALGVTTPDRLFSSSCDGSGQLTTTYTDFRGSDWVYRAVRDIDNPTRQNGPLFSIENPLNQVQLFGFGTNYLLAGYTNELGQTWRYNYDTNGNLTKLTDPVGATAQTPYAQQWSYDSLNNLTSYTDGDGNQVNYFYDDSTKPTLLTRIEEPATFDVVSGTMTTAITTMSYFDNSTTPGTYCTDETNCNHGQLEQVIDPNGVMTNFKYDQYGQLMEYAEGDNPAHPGTSVVSNFSTIDEASRVISSGTSGISGGTAALTNATASATAALGDGILPPCRNTVGGIVAYNGIGLPTAQQCAFFPVLPCDSSSNAPVTNQPIVGFPTIPCEAKLLPSISGQNSTPNVYDKFGRLQKMSMDLTTPDGPQTRTYEYSYDALDQLRSSKITTTEYTTSGSITREFTYTPNLASGTFTRSGPDGMVTVVQLDLAGRVQSVNRGGGFITANYSYLDNGLVERIDFGNGAATVYTYDVANRVTTIAHVNPAGQSALLMTYSYNNRDLPTMIVETGVLGGPVATVTFVYDDRGRLITERRVGDNAYDLAYAYDLGGNRRTKTDALAQTQVIYAYDIDQAAIYGTANNRLMTADTTDISACDPLVSSCPIISTDFYYYTFAGNVERVVTELANPAAGEPRFSAVRYQYAANAQTATYVLGETWDADGPDSGICPDNYTVTFAREYRYDSSRARYLDRMLDEQQAKLGNVVAVLSTWTDYDGVNTYSDFFSDGSTITNGNKYELGIATVKTSLPPGMKTQYVHSDMIGSLRAQSDSVGFLSYPVFTAFGEDMSNAGQRFGYAGRWGYQTNADFSSLHVGARYYNPASGRFLQRDPIGTAGGSNVYSYVENAPTDGVDPEGLQARMPAPRPNFSNIPDTPGFDYSPAPLTGNFKIDFYNAIAGPFCFPILPAPRRRNRGCMCIDYDGNDHFHVAPPPRKPKPRRSRRRSNPGYPLLIIGCFVEGTPVLIDDNTWIPIEDVEQHNNILTFDNYASESVLGQVLQKMTYTAFRIVGIELDGETISCTPEHPFWVVGKGWTQAGQLRRGQYLLNAEGKQVLIDNTNGLDLVFPISVYNMEVSAFHTFFVGQSRVLVHNKK